MARNDAHGGAIIGVAQSGRVWFAGRRERDVCVFPAARRGLSWLLPTCIANSIPLVAAESGELRTSLGEHSTRLTFREGDWSGLQSWFRDWLRNPKIVAQSLAAVRENLLNAAHARNNHPSLSQIFNFQQTLAP